MRTLLGKIDGREYKNLTTFRFENGIGYVINRCPPCVRSWHQ
jgi:hypothetical protein